MNVQITIDIKLEIIDVLNDEMASKEIKDYVWTNQGNKTTIRVTLHKTLHKVTAVITQIILSGDELTDKEAVQETLILLREKYGVFKINIHKEERDVIALLDKLKISRFAETKHEIIFVK